jgi:hypothetical protein
MSTQTRQGIGDTAYPVDAEDVPREPRAKLVLRRLDPWSVLKFSLLFYFCLLLAGVLAFAVVWLVLLNMGLFDTVTDFAASFNMDISFGAGAVFRWYVVLGLVGVLLWTIATVLLTLLFNLVNDITGGLEIVLAESSDQA